MTRPPFERPRTLKGRRFGLLLAALAVTLSACAKPRSGSPAQSVQSIYPVDPTAQDLEVDALHPELTPGPRYSLDSRVRIVVRNVNPYRFQYRIVADNHRWVEVSPGEFFSALLTGGLPSVNAPAARADEGLLPAMFKVSDKGVVTATGATGCKAPEWPVAYKYQEQVRSLLSEDRGIDAAIKAIQSDIDTHQQKASSYRQTMGSVLATAAEAKKAAHQNAILLSGVLDTINARLNVLPARVSAFGQSLARLEPLIGEQRKAYPTCEMFVEMAGDVLAMGSDTLVLRANVNALTEWRSKSDAELQFIRQVNDDPHRFTLIRVLDGFLGPTDVTVQVQRKAPAEKETDFATIFERRLNFGGRPRFRIGAGIAWTDLATREYAPRLEFVPPSQGRPGDTISVVAVKQISYNRVVPMLVLSTRLIDIDRGFLGGVHTTLGATLRKQADSTDPEFLVGLGLSGYDERLTLAGGGYVGRTQRLGEGVAINAQIPRGQNVPVDSRVIWRPGVMLSFKIK